MSSVGHGMFSYIPDSSMIGTVFCNFIANAMYRTHAFHLCVPFDTVCRCVAYSVIDVQLELQGAAWDLSDVACKTQSNYTNHAALPHAITFSVAGLQVHSSAAASPVTRLPFSLVTTSTASPSTFCFQKWPPVHFPYAPSPLCTARVQLAFLAPIPSPTFFCARSSELWFPIWKL